MKDQGLKSIGVFFLGGVVSGILTLALSLYFSWVIWIAAGLILALALGASLLITRQQGWINIKASAVRQLAAGAIIVVAYPISVLVMIGTIRSDQRGDEGFFSGLALAAVVGVVLVAVALSLLTRRLDKLSVLLLVIAGLSTIPLSRAVADLINEPNWHLLLFPVGEALVSALAGYWLIRQGQAIRPYNGDQVAVRRK